MCIYMLCYVFFIIYILKNDKGNNLLNEVKVI